MVSTPRANTPPVDLSLALFYYMLIEIYKIVYQKEKKNSGESYSSK